MRESFKEFVRAGTLALALAGCATTQAAPAQYKKGPFIPMAEEVMTADGCSEGYRMMRGIAKPGSQEKTACLSGNFVDVDAMRTWCAQRIDGTLHIKFGVHDDHKKDDPGHWCCAGSEK